MHKPYLFIYLSPYRRYRIPNLRETEEHNLWRIVRIVSIPFQIASSLLARENIT